jgi:hypothetical protein
MQKLDKVAPYEHHESSLPQLGGPRAYGLVDAVVFLFAGTTKEPAGHLLLFGGHPYSCAGHSDMMTYVYVCL